MKRGWSHRRESIWIFRGKLYKYDVDRNERELYSSNDRCSDVHPSLPDMKGSGSDLKSRQNRVLSTCP